MPYQFRIFGITGIAMLTIFNHTPTFGAEVLSQELPANTNSLDKERESARAMRGFFSKRQFERAISGLNELISNGNKFAVVELAKIQLGKSKQYEETKKHMTQDREGVLKNALSTGLAEAQTLAGSYYLDLGSTQADEETKNKYWNTALYHLQKAMSLGCETAKLFLEEKTHILWGARKFTYTRKTNNITVSDAKPSPYHTQACYGLVSCLKEVDEERAKQEAINSLKLFIRSAYEDNTEGMRMSSAKVLQGFQFCVCHERGKFNVRWDQVDAAGPRAGEFVFMACRSPSEFPDMPADTQVLKRISIDLKTDLKTSQR